jgi:LPS export ABC transporter protein LptC
LLGAPALLAGLVWLAGLLLVLAGCGTEDTPVGEPSVESEKARQVLDGAVMRETSMRGLLYVLRAERALTYGEDEPTQLEGVTLRFYDGEDAVRSVLTSRRGYIDSRSDLLVAEDSVVVVTPQGERLETHRLEWDPKTERVRTDLPFVLYRREDIVTGVGIEADPDLGSYSVSKELRAVVRDTPDLEEIDEDGSR